MPPSSLTAQQILGTFICNLPPMVSRLLQPNVISKERPRPINGRVISTYHGNNGRFVEHKFQNDLKKKKQSLTVQYVEWERIIKVAL
jgi:hypothetical protein